MIAGGSLLQGKKIMGKQKTVGAARRGSAHFNAAYRSRAFQYYVELGSGRSLEKLIDVLSEKEDRVPAYKTLRDWSTQEQWRKTISQFKQTALGKEVKTFHNRVEMANTIQDFVAKKELRKSGAEFIRRAEKELHRLDDIENTKKVKNIETLAVTGIALLKEARVEEGGVSDRIAEEKTVKLDDRSEETENFLRRISEIAEKNVKGQNRYMETIGAKAVNQVLDADYTEVNADGDA